MEHPVETLMAAELNPVIRVRGARVVAMERVVRHPVLRVAMPPDHRARIEIRIGHDLGEVPVLQTPLNHLVQNHQLRMISRRVINRKVTSRKVISYSL